MESYKSLLPDSGDISVALLARISMQLGTFPSTNSSANIRSPTTQSLVEFSSYNSSAHRVNALWFLSLILSLTTVLIGIVSLQWLREHQIYNDSLSPQQSLGIFHMRAEALERWYVPNIFSTLPLLLEAALMLFFFGIVDFLFGISHPIAILVATAVGFATVFLILTTTLPMLQCFPVSLRQPHSDSPLPTPCPYKSPQSLALIKFCTFSRRCFNTTHELVVLILHFITVRIPSFSRHVLNLGQPEPRDTWSHRLLPDHAYYYWAHRKWINFDRTWIKLRNEHFDITRKRKAEDSSSFAPTSEAFYDTVRAIATAVHINEHRDAVVFAVYHCFQDLFRSEFRYQRESSNHHLQACYRDLLATSSPIENIADIVSDPSFELLHDIHTGLFLLLPGIFYKTMHTSSIFGKHNLEIYTRILANLYGQQPKSLLDGSSRASTGFFRWYTMNMATLVRMPETQDGSLFYAIRERYSSLHCISAFFEQFFMVFNCFIQKASTITNHETIINTFHTHTDLYDFLTLAAYLTWRTAEKAAKGSKILDASLLSIFDTLELIRTSLSAVRHPISKKDATSSDSDFLFFCVTLYFVRLWEEKPQSQHITSTITEDYSLIPSLTGILVSLERDVLKPYEDSLSKAKFFKMYGAFVQPMHLPGTYFSSTWEGRNFERYGTTIQTTLTLRISGGDTSTWKNMSMSSSKPEGISGSTSSLIYSEPDVMRDDEARGGRTGVNHPRLV